MEEEGEDADGAEEEVDEGLTRNDSQSDNTY